MKIVLLTAMAACFASGVAVASEQPNPPLLFKFFQDFSVIALSPTTVEFQIFNPNSVNLTNVSFTDTLPAGLVVANPSVVGTADTSCGGTVTAVAGSKTVSVSGIVLTPEEFCSITVNVFAGATGGEQFNVTSAITSAESSAGSAASASVTIDTTPYLLAHSWYWYIFPFSAPPVIIPE